MNTFVSVGFSSRSYIWQTPFITCTFKFGISGWKPFVKINQPLYWMEFYLPRNLSIFFMIDSGSGVTLLRSCPRSSTCRTIKPNHFVKSEKKKKIGFSWKFSWIVYEWHEKSLAWLTTLEIFPLKVASIGSNCLCKCYQYLYNLWKDSGVCLSPVQIQFLELVYSLWLNLLHW